jgi:hypothetical protein
MLDTARQKILSTSWNVQFVAFNTSEKLSNNLDINKNEILVNVSNSTVKNIFENGMIPKLIQKNGPPQSRQYITDAH